jgi:hypothetical protein
MSLTLTTPEDLAAFEARLTALEAELAALDARVTALEGGTGPPAPDAPPPIPELARWEAQMLEGAAATRALVASVPLAPTPVDPAATYYDGDRVMQQIATYTGDLQWHAAAGDARRLYRDAYVLPNGGAVPGYWNFTTGLRLAGDAETVILLANTAAYNPDHTPIEWTESVVCSREVAYAILAHIDSELCGATPRARRAQLVTQAYGHLAQFEAAFADAPTREPGRPTPRRPAESGRFVKPGPHVVPPPEDVNPQPFMVGLTCHALIRDWEQTADARALPAIQSIADTMWGACWMPESECMWYDEAGRGPAPDLNLLIAPLYAWVWRQTRDLTYLDMADRLFAGGVRQAYLSAGKHFNQNYWWSFDYVDWRSA